MRAREARQQGLCAYLALLVAAEIAFLHRTNSAIQRLTLGCTQT